MLVVDCEQRGDVLEIYQKVTHRLRPTRPSHALLQLHGVDP